PRRRRARRSVAVERLRRGARDEGASDDDSCEDVEGERAVGHRRERRLARQGAQEGRRDGQGGLRARKTDGWGRIDGRDSWSAIEEPSRWDRRLFKDSGTSLQEGRSSC